MCSSSAIYVPIHENLLTISSLTRSRAFCTDERFNDSGGRFYFLSGSVVESASRSARKGSLFAFHVRVVRSLLRPPLYRISAETECARISGTAGLAPPGRCEMCR